MGSVRSFRRTLWCTRSRYPQRASRCRLGSSRRPAGGCKSSLDWCRLCCSRLHTRSGTNDGYHSRKQAAAAARAVRAVAVAAMAARAAMAAAVAAMAAAVAAMAAAAAAMAAAAPPAAGTAPQRTLSGRLGLYTTCQREALFEAGRRPLRPSPAVPPRVSHVQGARYAERHCQWQARGEWRTTAERGAIRAGEAPANVVRPRPAGAGDR